MPGVASSQVLVCLFVYSIDAAKVDTWKTSAFLTSTHQRRLCSKHIETFKSRIFFSFLLNVGPLSWNPCVMVLGVSPGRKTSLIAMMLNRVPRVSERGLRDGKQIPQRLLDPARSGHSAPPPPLCAQPSRLNARRRPWLWKKI